MKYLVTEYNDYTEIKVEGRQGRPSKRLTFEEALAYIADCEKKRLGTKAVIEDGPAIKPYLMEQIEKHVGLARSIGIRRYNTATHALDRDEMISVAYWGLCDAARRWEKYCEGKGFDNQALNYFTTYAWQRIKGAVEDFIRQQDWATRSLRDRSKKLVEAGGEGATRQELSNRTGMPLQEIHEVIAGMNRAPVSLTAFESTGSNDDNISYYTELVSTDSVESTVEVNELLEVFGDAVAEMSGEAQVIIGLHYYKNMELKKIANVLDITEARASQIHTQACLQLLEVMKEAADYAN